jgi:hypothetical protein
MKKHALMVILLGAIALVVAALAPPRGAAAQPQPTMVISPSSGPCDATVEVAGQGFPANAAIELGVGGIGGQSIEGHLGSVRSDADGRLSFSALFGYLGCDMASVTKERTGGDQLWLVGYVLEPGPSGSPTARTLARAPYTFTTTQSTLPIAILKLSPSSGPCDATIEARGVLFEPGSNVVLQVARPNSEGFMGTLATVRAGQGGDFAASFALGTLGCEAAALDAEMKNHAGAPAELIICSTASRRARCATYGTTTAATLEATPIALPQTGQGGTSPGMDIRPMAVVAAVLGVVLLTGGLFAARRRLR